MRFNFVIACLYLMSSIDAYIMWISTYDKTKYLHLNVKQFVLSFLLSFKMSIAVITRITMESFKPVIIPRLTSQEKLLKNSFYPFTTLCILVFEWALFNQVQYFVENFSDFNFNYSFVRSLWNDLVLLTHQFCVIYGLY